MCTSGTYPLASRQTSYGLSKGLDALGVKGGQVPGLEDGGMVPVITVGNLGNNFAAQVFEGRGLVALLAFVLAPQEIPTLSLQSVAAGGIVIERIRMQTAQLGGFAVPAGAPPYPNPTWGLARGSVQINQGTATSVGVSIGGPAPKSVVRYGNTPVAAWSSYSFYYGGNEFATDLDIWVPPGQFLDLGFLSYSTLAPFPTAFFMVQWREIPEAQGGS